MYGIPRPHILQVKNIFCDLGQIIFAVCVVLIEHVCGYRYPIFVCFNYYIYLYRYLYALLILAESVTQVLSCLQYTHTSTYTQKNSCTHSDT